MPSPSLEASFRRSTSPVPVGNASLCEPHPSRTDQHARRAASSTSSALPTPHSRRRRSRRASPSRSMASSWATCFRPWRSRHLRHTRSTCRTSLERATSCTRRAVISARTEAGIVRPNQTSYDIVTRLTRVTSSRHRPRAPPRCAERVCPHRRRAGRPALVSGRTGCRPSWSRRDRLPFVLQDPARLRGRPRFLCISRLLELCTSVKFAQALCRCGTLHNVGVDERKRRGCISALRGTGRRRRQGKTDRSTAGQPNEGTMRIRRTLGYVRPTGTERREGGRPTVVAKEEGGRGRGPKVR